MPVAGRNNIHSVMYEIHKSNLTVHTVVHCIMKATAIYILGHALHTLTAMHRSITPLLHTLTAMHRSITPALHTLTAMHRSITPALHTLTAMHRSITPALHTLTAMHRSITPSIFLRHYYYSSLRLSNNTK